MLLKLFGLDLGLVGWLLALVGAVIGAAVMSRFKDWAIIILAAIVGALLCTSGLQMLIPSLDGVIASLITVVLTVVSVVYQGGFIGKK
jgi:fucose permease